MLYNLIFNLLFVHVVCDFYLQTNSSCADKIKDSIKGRALWIHSLITGVLSWLVIWNIKGWWLGLSLMVIHLLIDWLKSYLEIRYDIFKVDYDGKVVIKGGKIRYELYAFVLDQLLHIVTIVGIAYLWYYFNCGWQQLNWLKSLLFEHPVRVYSVVALLLILKPANILLLQILQFCKLDDTEDSEDGDKSFHAGALIGYTERALMLLFVVLTQYEAIGFLIAAKSILRFSEASSGNVKSEYVLSGTLLSVIFSLILGLWVIKMPII